MPPLPELLHDTAAVTAAVTATGGLLYGGVLSAVALISVLAPTPERRRDARSTLTILLRRRRSG
ncbi:hypothetical protein GCM10010232_56710 [Streptomyces amakusaensis]|uniref:Uncharacterized protein n=1 Tax=Streptomyces amakusaensis TaxID=67271 RepID=A0ABW0ASH1_9ACTN